MLARQVKKYKELFMLTDCYGRPTTTVSQKQQEDAQKAEERAINQRYNKCQLLSLKMLKKLDGISS